MNDSQEWKTRRNSLKILKSHSSQSSNLKKKQSLINRLKNISSEKFPAFINELSNESFNKFHTEIVNSMLLNQCIINPGIKNYESVFADIRKLVEIVYLFSFDQLFISYLTGNLKKLYTSNWSVCSIFIEVFFLISKTKKNSNSLEFVIKTILKSFKDTSSPFLLYCLESFDLDTSEFIDILKNEIKSANENTKEILRKCSEIVGISEEIVVKDEYVAIVKPIQNEFDFYLDAKVCDTKQYGKFVPSMLKNLEKKNPANSFLDFIGQSIYDRPDMVAKLIKKKKHCDFIPKIARILSRCYMHRPNMIDSILYSTETEEDLILIGECTKFSLIPPDSLFNLIYDLISRSEFEKICKILWVAGRFLLIRKETNKKMIALVEKLKITIPDEHNKLVFFHTLSYIINPECSKIEIVDFLRWFFNSCDYKKTDLFFSIKNSKKFLFCIIAQPNIFENDKNLVKLIENMNLKEKAIDFYIDSIRLIYKSDKLLTLGYVNILAAITKLADEQKSILNSIMGLFIDKEWILKIAIILLDNYGPFKHLEIFEQIKPNRKYSANIERMFFNLCEKYQIPHDEEEDMDSFEREMLLMDDSD